MSALSELTQRGRTARDAAEVQADLLAAALQRSTDVIELLSGRITNHVLLVETIVFDTDGMITRQFGTPAGSLVVVSYSSAEIMVYAGDGGSTTRPAKGIGTMPVPANAAMTLPLAARAVTLWGTAGDRVHLQAYSGLQAFAAGSIR